MRKKKLDPDRPSGKLTRVDDFLPAPDKLVVPQQMIKITISLNKSSVDFLKQQALAHHTQYQKMIRVLVDRYVARYSS